MIRERPPLSPEVGALLEHEREIPALSAATRARAIARARAALVAGLGRSDDARRAAPVPWRHPRWAAAAALFCILGGAVGAAAYQFRAYLAPPAEIHPLPAPVRSLPSPRVGLARRSPHQTRPRGA